MTIERSVQHSRCWSYVSLANDGLDGHQQRPSTPPIAGGSQGVVLPWMSSVQCHVKNEMNDSFGHPSSNTFPTSTCSSAKSSTHDVKCDIVEASNLLYDEFSLVELLSHGMTMTQQRYTPPVDVLSSTLVNLLEVLPAVPLAAFLAPATLHPLYHDALLQRKPRGRW